MRIEIRDDLDLERIAESGQCFRWEALAGDTWRIPHRGRRLYITRVKDGLFDLDCAPAEFDALWRAYFDLDTDYRGIRARISRDKDPYLWEAARAEQGIRILRQDPWEALVSFIISQNRNIPAIRRSVELLCRAAGAECTDGRGKTFYAFPEPEAVLALTEAELSACRLGYRTKYVRAAALAAAEGSLDLAALGEAGQEEALAALTALYGVGNKVACCAALFGLHQLDAFPVDVWMRRVLEAEYPGGYPKEAYSPYNGVYQQYLFAYSRSRGKG